MEPCRAWEVIRVIRASPFLCFYVHSGAAAAHRSICACVMVWLLSFATGTSQCRWTFFYYSNCQLDSEPERSRHFCIRRIHNEAGCRKSHGYLKVAFRGFCPRTDFSGLLVACQSLSGGASVSKVALYGILALAMFVIVVHKIDSHLRSSQIVPLGADWEMKSRPAKVINFNMLIGSKSF